MESRHKTYTIFIIQCLFLTLPTLVYNKTLPKKLAYLLHQKNDRDVQIPVCTTHGNIAIIFHLKVHESLMINIYSNENIAILPKFHCQSTTNHQTETKSCYAEHIKQPGNSMIRIKCYMWFLSDKKARKDSYIFSATYKNHTIWEYERTIIPNNYLFYCFEPPVYDLRVERRFYDKTHVEVDWNNENDVEKFLSPSKKFLVWQSSVKTKQQHPSSTMIIPAQYNKCPVITCKQIIKGLDQCKIYTICLQTNFSIEAIDAKYWPPLQITCVTSDEIFRNCSNAHFMGTTKTALRNQNKNNIVGTKNNTVEKKGIGSENEMDIDREDILAIVVSLLVGVLVLIPIIMFARRKTCNLSGILEVSSNSNRNITIIPRSVDHINNISNYNPSNIYTNPSSTNISGTSSTIISGTSNRDHFYEEI